MYIPSLFLSLFAFVCLWCTWLVHWLHRAVICLYMYSVVAYRIMNITHCYLLVLTPMHWLLVCKAVLFVWTAHFDSLHRPHLPWAVCSKNWEDRQDSWSCGMARCVCMLYVIVDSYRYIHMHYKYYVLCNLRRNLRNPGIAQCISSVLMMCSNLKNA